MKSVSKVQKIKCKKINQSMSLIYIHRILLCVEIRATFEYLFSQVILTEHVPKT